MAKHRLVALGDSMTQGFMSGAIFATDLSYPSLIAREMGLDPSQFRVPAFSPFGGLPVNLERLLRLLEKEYGPDLSAWDSLGAPFRIRTWMDEIEDYWERGSGTAPRAPEHYHNLAIWGFSADDVVHLKASDCKVKCDAPSTDDFFNQIPENAFYRTALTVLNPAQVPALMGRTAMDCAMALASDGGIENLIVNLGANNALGTVTALGDPLLSGDDILSDPVKNREKYNLWRPEHFDHFYAELVAGLESLNADRVFVANVPHVTIAPIARGVGTTNQDRLASDPRYFKFYTRFWITDESFDPGKHKYITGEQAKMIDETVDKYNATIKQVVDAHANWHLVNVNGYTERLAFRRFREIGLEVPGGVYEFPPGWNEALQAANQPELTTHYFTMEDNHPALSQKSGSSSGVPGVTRPFQMSFGVALFDSPRSDRRAVLLGM